METFSREKNNNKNSIDNSKANRRKEMYCLCRTTYIC